MKKAVFFDIDGTLWDEHMQIPHSTAEAVRRLRERGNYAFICSGRSRANIRSSRLLDIGFDGVVAACGAHIDFAGEKRFEQLLDGHQVAHALDVIKRHGIAVILEGPRYIYVDADDFRGDAFVTYLRRELGDDAKPITGTAHFEVNKMSAVTKGADIAAFGKELGEGFDMIVHGENLVEIVPNGYSKATGIKRVCDLLGIKKEHTYAFGDSANDLDMLMFVSHGIAMGNATDEAKRAAEYVTTDIMEDGIKNGLEYYGLI